MVTSLMGLGEPVIAFLNGKPIVVPPMSQPTAVDFGPGRHSYAYAYALLDLHLRHRQKGRLLNKSPRDDLCPRSPWRRKHFGTFWNVTCLLELVALGIGSESETQSAAR